MVSGRCSEASQLMAIRHPAPPSVPAWMAPHRFVAIVLLPCAGLVAWGAAAWRADVTGGPGVPAYLTAPITLIWFSALGALYLGSRLASATFRPPAATPIPSALGLDLLFWLCIAGYATWFGPMLAGDPGLVLAAVRGEPGAVYAFREATPNIPGMTTLTQFGIAYAILHADLRLRGGIHPPKRFTLYLTAVLVLGLLRASANSERLALVEIALPLAFVAMASPAASTTRRRRWARTLFPLIVVAVAPILFVAFEYNRSWVNHYQFISSSLVDFGLERLSVYYVSALNNMAGYMSNSEWPTYTGEQSFGWLYRFFGRAAPIEDGFATFLHLHASPEFNNRTGILTVFHDWGIALGLGYFAGLGALYGYAHLCFAARRGWARHLFPVFLLGLFELLRIDYVADGRAVAALIGLGLARALTARTISVALPPSRMAGRQASSANSSSRVRWRSEKLLSDSSVTTS